MTDYPLEPDRRAMDAIGRRALALVADVIDGLPDAPATNVGDVEPLLTWCLLPPREEPGEFGELPWPQPPPASTNTIEISMRDRHHQVVDLQGQRWLPRH
jgi:hypothetical protein